jgi:hypothetical protein
MNIQSFKNKKGFLILICAILILGIYSIDLFKLNYRFMGWKQFGRLPVPASQIQYFIPDTPNVIGYTEASSGESVSCATSVAYLKTNSDETYRCCNTGDKISCLGGKFTSDIPIPDEECKNRLQQLFAIPVSLAGTRDYQMYANCQQGANVEIAEITVVQIDNNGQLLWKQIDSPRIAVFSSGLKCIVAPVLFILIITMIVMVVRGKSKEPIRRLW